MVDVTQQKCACADCLCIVKIDDAVKRGERRYCSEACASGHPDGSGCGHTGCACHG